jgi:hypothetical protein
MSLSEEERKVFEKDLKEVEAAGNRRIVQARSWKCVTPFPTLETAGL